MSKSDSNRVDRNSETKKPRGTSLVSKRDRDGRMVEMVYGRAQMQTRYAVWKKGTWSLTSKVRLSDGRVAIPWNPANNLLTHKVVLFPSEPEEYGSKASLLGAISQYIRRYVDLEPDYERIVPYYVLLSWIYDGYQEIPYLRVKGEPGCGKTRFLQVVGSVCYKPIFISGSSTISPMFRILDAVRGTVVLDEGDFKFSDERAQIVKILNNGAMRGFPVLRSEASNDGKEFNPRAFHVFGPKLIGTRGLFQDRALESRCITEHMRSRPLRSGVPISMSAEYESEALGLRNRLLLFRFRNYLHDGPGCEAAIDGLDPRLNQMFAPLLSVIDNEVDRRQVLALAAEKQRQTVSDRGMDIEGQLLSVIRESYMRGDASPTMRDLASSLGRMSSGEGGWKVTPRFVGQVLRGRLGLFTARTARGYVLSRGHSERLNTLFVRYGLSPVESGSPGASSLCSQCSSSGKCSHAVK